MEMGEPADSKKLDDNAQRARYEAAVKALQFELDLFWKRSLFFWGFIGAAFIALAAAKDQPRLQAAIASFGFICSRIWTLANRGGKYWYENWEQKLVRAESSVTGHLYGNPEIEGWPVSDNLPRLERLRQRAFKSRRYSPSRLAIALSYYVFFLWFCLLASKFYLIASGLQSWYSLKSRDGITLILVVLSFAFGALLPWLCYSEDTKDKPTTKLKAEKKPEANKSTTSASDNPGA
jgi:hypothetical protein